MATIKQPVEVGLAGFLKNYRDDTDKADPLYIGIDPGAEGAVGLICGKYHFCFSIPTAKVVRGKKKTKKGNPMMMTVPDYQGILDLFGLINTVVIPADVRACLEQSPPSMGPGRQYAEILLARHYATWPLYLLSLGWSLEEVSPSKWKEAMGLSNKDKETGRQMAAKMFPRANVSGDKGDKAEALLLAEWKRRLDNGGL